MGSYTDIPEYSYVIVKTSIFPLFCVLNWVRFVVVGILNICNQNCLTLLYHHFSDYYSYYDFVKSKEKHRVRRQLSMRCTPSAGHDKVSSISMCWSMRSELPEYCVSLYRTRRRKMPKACVGLTTHISHRLQARSLKWFSNGIQINTYINNFSRVVWLVLLVWPYPKSILNGEGIHGDRRWHFHML